MELDTLTILSTLYILHFIKDVIYLTTQQVKLVL